MIYYPIEFLRDSGVKDLLIILGGNSVGDFVQLLGDGAQLGVRITYRYQHGSGGIAAALKLARDFVGEEPFAICLGDNIMEFPITNLSNFFDALTEAPTAHVYLHSTDRATEFGVPTFDENDKIIKITEKPKDPDSNFAVTGLYIYDKFVWSMINSLEPSSRGELEITDINNWYLKNGRLTYSILNGWWRDCGSIETLFEAMCLTSGFKDYLSGIYQIRCIINQMVYIGSSCSLPTRKLAHFRELRKNIHYNKYLQNAWNKYGEENFIFEILEIVSNLDLLKEKEKKWINILKSYLRDCGYNMIKDPTVETKFINTKQKLSLSKIGSNNSFYGKTHSEEEKRKMSDRNSGSKNPNSKLVEHDIVEIKDLLLQKINQKEIAKKFGVHVSTIERLSSKLRKGLL